MRGIDAVGLWSIVTSVSSRISSVPLKIQETFGGSGSQQ